MANGRWYPTTSTDVRTAYLRFRESEAGGLAPCAGTAARTATGAASRPRYYDDGLAKDAAAIHASAGLAFAAHARFASPAIDTLVFLAAQQRVLFEPDSGSGQSAASTFLQRATGLAPAGPDILARLPAVAQCHVLPIARRAASLTPALAAIAWPTPSASTVAPRRRVDLGKWANGMEPPADRNVDHQRRRLRTVAGRVCAWGHAAVTIGLRQTHRVRHWGSMFELRIVNTNDPTKQNC